MRFRSALEASPTSPHSQEATTSRAHAEARSLSPEGETICVDIPLRIEPQSGLMPAQIAARTGQMRLRAECRGIPLAAIIIDHIGLIRPSKRSQGDRVRQMTEITTGLKGLAEKLGIPVVGLSQLNREGENAVERPVLSLLTGTGR